MTESVVIPEILKTRLMNLGKHFLRVSKHGKKPIDQGWNKEENRMEADDSTLQAWVAEGGNYGIAGGGGLIIMDLDTEEVKERSKSLPETFTVETPGSKGWHMMYRAGIEDIIELREKETGRNLGHIKGEASMVVGPGCYHPDGGQYRIIKDVPIASVTMSQLNEAFKDYIVPRNEMALIEEMARKEGEQSPIELDITQVVPIIQLKRHGNEYYGPSPSHGSSTGQNFWVNPSKNCWHCFRHSTGGGPLLFMAVQEGILDCSEAKPGALRGDIFKKVIARAKELGYIKETNGTIVKNSDKGYPKILSDPDIWNIIDGQLDFMIKEDYEGRMTTFLIAISPLFQIRPSHIMLNGESALGKSWLAVNAVNMLPQENVRIIGSSTQRAWFYDGEPVTAENDQNQQKFIDYYLINWKRKTIVILDNVDEKTIKDLKPVMSHDRTEESIDIQTTMKTKSGKQKMYKLKIIGCPSFVNCTTNLHWNDELSTRHFFVTPKDSPIKFKAAAEAILEREVSGEKMPQPPRIEEIRDALRYLVSQNFKIVVKRDVAEKIMEKFPLKTGRDMRDYERALVFIESSGWIHALQREKDGKGNIIADERDFKLIEPLLNKVLLTSRYGTSQQVIDFFERIINKMYTEKAGAALQRDEIVARYVQTYGRAIRSPNMTDLLKTLEEIGKVESMVDPTDKRKRLIKIVVGGEKSNYYGDLTRIPPALTGISPIISTFEPKNPLQLIIEYIKEKKSEVPKADILKVLSANGIIGEKAEQTIERLQKENMILEPKAGYYLTVM